MKNLKTAYERARQTKLETIKNLLILSYSYDSAEEKLHFWYF